MNKRITQKPYNLAQKMLIAIGGTAAMVAGYMGSYYADYQQPKKAKRKPGMGYGETIRAVAANKRKEVLEDKRIAAQ